MARDTGYTDMRSVTLTPEQGLALEKIARDEDRSVANVIRIAVNEFLQKRSPSGGTTE